jgi:CoA:oxalate CoA-transferase
MQQDADQDQAAPSPDQTTAPLAGIVILDLSRWMSGPYAGMMLADAGATVIKVEPAGGETTRSLRPALPDNDDTEVSGYFLRMNRRKHSVRIDLKSAAGKERFLDLVRRADVLLENFRPDVMTARGLGYDEVSKINPRLVYCSISGFGHTPGPYRDWPAFNQVAEAIAGVVHWDPTGTIPSPVGPAVGDLFPSMHAVTGILMALLRRAVTGEGSFVDIAMYDSLVSLNEMAISWAAMTAEEYHHGSSANLNLAPYGFYPAKDGYVCIGVATNDQWARLAAVMGRPELADDPRLATGQARVVNNAELIAPLLIDWLATRGKHEVARQLAAEGVPSAPVQSGQEVLADRQAIGRGMVEQVLAPGGGSWPIPGSPITITPAPAYQPPQTPALGRDDDVPLDELTGRDADGRPVSAAALARDGEGSGRAAAGAGR